MSGFLILITIAIISTLLYGQVPEQFIPIMNKAAIAAPTLLLVIHVVSIFKKSAPTSPEPQPVEEPAPEEPSAAVSLSQEANSDAAVVQFLARLQEKGRLLDFLMDDIAAYDNESVGAAARIVHQGCCEVLDESFTIETVHAGAEMETITLADNYDSAAYRLSGKVPESAPFEGNVLHRGWKTTRVNLPKLVLTADNINSARSIIAPAEVEIS
ncbi:MAG: DUF2760 domain-containing protein [Desulfuromonas sp.]|nr:DUF2760 domain-containing protein [Desulfuromonas sp.]